MQTPPSLYVGKKYTAHIYMNWDGLKYPKQFCFNNFVQTSNKICITNCCFFGSNHLKNWSQWGPLISFHLLIEQFGVTTQRILKKTAAAGWGYHIFNQQSNVFCWTVGPLSVLFQLSKGLYAIGWHAHSRFGPGYTTQGQINESGVILPCNERAKLNLKTLVLYII